MPRKSAYARLLDHFHTHPQGRIHEFLMWFTAGAIFILFAFYAWRVEWVSEPIGLIIAIIGLCFIGWAFLPSHRARTKPTKPRSPRSKRK